MCYLMCSIGHLKAICAIDVGILSHQLCLAMNGCNAEIVLGRDNNEFSTIELNPITFHKQIVQIMEIISIFVLENFVTNLVQHGCGEGTIRERLLKIHTHLRHTNTAARLFLDTDKFS